MGRRKNQPDQRAMTRGAGFTGLPHVVQDSEAHRNLSLWARAILMEILRRFNGYNNGRIAISQRELAHALNTTNFRKIGTAIAELIKHGMIDVQIEGEWKQRQAREYRITFISTGDHTRHVQATEDYRSWSQPVKFCDDDVSARKGQSADDVSARREKAADDVSARIASHQRKTANPENVAADDVSSLICKPYPPAQTDEIGSTETPILADTVGGRSVADGNLSSDAVIRDAIGSVWSTLDRDGRTALAKRHGVSASEIASYLSGHADIAFPKLVAIRHSAFEMVSF
ncbi:MAG: hypothetical protein AB7G25_07985 [Sphingomonadaceae bacterium]